ncbi:MAG: 30S ribosomal protein S18 [Epsilonproteobacteria bacterium]|nr:30S ribosomal protein S18 [Campylobacterota bacterium]|tara:strand:+ start:213 stop:500 length:288 start_codon:yes stop_codon:yes gene_type:complete
MTKKIKLKISARLLKKRFRKKNAGSRKQCRFTNNPEMARDIDYKNTDLLSKFLTERGKILPSRISGNSSKFQRLVSREIKKARIMALLPFCATEY